MELRYEKALEEHNLKVADLSEDAKIGIESIDKVIQGINLLQKKGKQVTEKTLAKLKAMDKWVYFEILDQVHETDKNEEEIPYEEEEVIDEAERLAEQEEEEEEDESGLQDDSELLEEQEEEEEAEETEAVNVNDPKGFAIDNELKVAHESGKHKITLEELKTVAPTAHKVIFDGYDESGDNGVETSHFLLIETEEEVFTLTKK
jgi:hypothetical protein